MKLWMNGFVAVVFALGVSAMPARAASVNLISIQTPTQNVACPLTLELDGAISGRPFGPPFQYWFRVKIDDVYRETEKFTLVMPLPGVVLKVKYAVPITTSSDKSKLNYAELVSADFGPSLANQTVSKPVDFSVTCAKPISVAIRNAEITLTTNPHKSAITVAPTPAPLIKTAIGPVPPPNPPTGMAATQDPTVCAQHMGSAAVGNTVCLNLGPSSGTLALVWNGGNCNTCFDGYHLYRVDSGLHDLLPTNPDKSRTGNVIGRQDLFDGRCYAVTAYSARAGESTDSTQACIGSEFIQKTDSFNPTNQRSSFQRNSNGNMQSGSDDLGVGFTDQTSKALTGDSFYNVVYRMGLLFDLSKLSGKTVTKAVLHLHVNNAYTGAAIEFGKFAVDHHTSCATRISAGIDRWWQYGDWIAGSGATTARSTSGPDADIDVTSYVQRWTYGPNFGFVLYGAEENFNAFTEKSCLTLYTSGSSLDVIHN